MISKELLEALKTALQNWTDEFKYVCRKTPQWVIQARAAIAKAEAERVEPVAWLRAETTRPEYFGLGVCPANDPNGFPVYRIAPAAAVSEPAKLFDWTPSFSKTQPNSVLLAELNIFHPDGQSQTLFAGPTETHYYSKAQLDEAYEAGMSDAKACKIADEETDVNENMDWYERRDMAFAALHRAAILEELTGEMPEPVAWRGRGGTIWKTFAMANRHDKNAMPLHTATQLREYAAGLVAKKDAENLGYAKALLDLEAEVARLTAASNAWCEVEKKL